MHRMRPKRAASATETGARKQTRFSRGKGAATSPRLRPSTTTATTTTTPTSRSTSRSSSTRTQPGESSTERSRGRGGRGRGRGRGRSRDDGPVPKRPKAADRNMPAVNGTASSAEHAGHRGVGSRGRGVGPRGRGVGPRGRGVGSRGRGVGSRGRAWHRASTDASKDTERDEVRSSSTPERIPKTFGRGRPLRRQDDGEEQSQGHGQKRKRSLSARPASADTGTRKPNFELVSRMNEKGNKLRAKTTSAKEKQTIIQQILDEVGGKVAEVALKHDSTRVLQWIIQYGTEVQREKVLSVLISHLIELSKKQYSHFLVLKMLEYCTTQHERQRLSDVLRGSVCSLACHSIGCRVIESALQLLPPRLTKPLRSEFYGRQFVLMCDKLPASLADLLAQRDDRRNQILDAVRDVLGRMTAREVLGFAMAQHLLWEYAHILFEARDTQRIDELAALVLESISKLLSTKHGAKVVAVLATFVGAKERKKMLKLLKPVALQSLCSDTGYIAIIRLVDVTDDTVTVQKTLLQELAPAAPLEVQYTASGEQLPMSAPPLATVCAHKEGSKLLLLLLAPKQTRYFSPDELELLQVEQFERAGVVTPVRKKDVAVQRIEHLRFLRTPLVDVCAEHTPALLFSVHGGRVLEEVVRVFQPLRVVRSIAASVFAHEPAVAGEAPEAAALPAYEHQIAHHVLKRILEVEAEMEAKDQSADQHLELREGLEEGWLSEQLLHQLRSTGSMQQVLQCSRGCFILAALCTVPRVRKRAIAFIRAAIDSGEGGKDDEQASSAGLLALRKQIQQ